VTEASRIRLPGVRTVEQRLATAKRATRYRERHRDVPTNVTLDREIAQFFVTYTMHLEDGERAAVGRRLMETVVTAFVAAGYDEEGVKERLEYRIALLERGSPERAKVFSGHLQASLRKAADADR
jgi:hypothetical protein